MKFDVRIFGAGRHAAPAPFERRTATAAARKAHSMFHTFAS
jgi:hypothetical protein